nr:hypothetical protein [uncultured Schaedlerella sp.]
MKKKLTNTRVINSIGIGILAMVTAGTPVLAEINAMNDNSTADTSVSDIPAEPVEQAAPSQNEQILQTLTDTQGLIQEMVQAPESGQTTMEGSGTPAEIPSAEEPGTPAETVPAEGAAGSENVTPPATEDTTTIGDGSSTGADGSQTSGDGDAGDNGTAEQPPAEGEETQNPPADEGAEDAENGDVTQGADTGTTEGQAPTVKDHLQDTADSLGAIINDINGLEQKNAEAKDAVDKYEDAVDKPVVDLLVDWAADASSDAADAAESAAVDEETARDQAQIAVDAQNRGYASREEAEAARQQAQAAADAAEEAYRSAQAAVEEAENKVANAGATVEELERLKSRAELALAEMNAKVEAAQLELERILADYGITPGKFDEEQLEGEAKAAYKSAENALKQAEDEKAAAQRDYDASSEGVKKAEEDFAAAASGLNELKQKLTDAENAKTISEEVLGKEEYKAVIIDYNKQLQDNEKIKLDLDQAKAALDQAKAALDKAQEVKNKSDEIVNNAEAAVEAAESDEALKIEKANNAKAAVEQAIEENEKNIKEALKLAEQAEKEVGEAKDEAKRAVDCLQSLKDNAAEAEKDLIEKQEKFAEAETEHQKVKDEFEAAEATLNEIRNAVLNKGQIAVQEAQEKAKSGKTEDKLNLAIELVLYQYFLDEKVIVNLETKKIEENKYEIVMKDQDGEEKVYLYSEEDGKIVICENVDNEWIDYRLEENFNGEIEKLYTFDKPELRKAQQAFVDAQNKLDSAQKEYNDAYDKVIEAENIRDEAVQQAAVVAAWEEMAEALDKVHKNAAALVEAERNYQENFEKDKVNIVEKLDSLITKRTDLDLANKNLADAKLAKDAVDKAITELTKLTAQGAADSKAYYNLVNAYNTAKADYDDAMDALDQCIVSRNRAQTERDRARTAANAVFRYITDNNTGTVTPIQPGTLNPIYGTIIDSITSPIIGNTGVSTPSGTTGTGYGYTGYTYTVGGQPVYAVGETAAPEEEQAEENLVSVEEAAVPLAEVGENNNRRTTNARNTTNTRKVSDEKIPLADVETENNKISWWWILVIALLGATGTELYIRHQKKEEEERKSRTDKQGYAKI